MKHLCLLLSLILLAGCAVRPATETAEIDAPPTNANPVLVAAESPTPPTAMSPTPTPSPAATSTPIPASNTPAPPTATSAPPTALIQATNTPFPAMTPTATGQFNGQVAEDRGNLRLRAAPSIDGRIMTLLDEFTQLSVIGNTGTGWLRVDTENGESGWVMERYVDLYVAANTIPNVNPDPIPDSAAVPAQADAPPTDCGDATAPRLTVGGMGRVTPGGSNNLRFAPGLDARLLGQIPAGDSFTVLEGPFCRDGLLYWRVNHNGREGWTAEGNDGDYWLEPF